MIIWLTLTLGLFIGLAIGLAVDARRPSRPRFTYHQWVRVTGGFYAGFEGKILSQSLRHYAVMLKTSKYIDLWTVKDIKADHLEPIEATEPTE